MVARRHHSRGTGRRRASRAASSVEQREAGRPAARHADEVGAGALAQPVEHRRRSRAPALAPALRGRCAPRASRRADRDRRRPTRRTPRRSTRRSRGLTSSTGVPGDALESSTSVSVARPLPARGQAEQAGRDVAAQRRRDRRRMRRIDPPQRGQQPQRRRRIGRSAADPRRHRQVLVEVQRGAIRSTRDDRARAARVAARSRPDCPRPAQKQPPRIGPLMSAKPRPAGSRPQPVAVGAEGEHRLDLVAPVGAPCRGRGARG